MIVQPDTVMRWHRSGFRLYWRWKSRSRAGRPKVPIEVRSLIRRMSMENPLWGAPRIPWRTAEAWDRGRAVDGCQVHGQAAGRVGPDMEDVLAQPCAWPWSHGLPRGSDDQLSAADRAGDFAT